MQLALRVAREALGCVAMAISCVGVAQKNVLAPTPPMGWNSWDSHGLTINEAQFRANVDVLAKRLKPVGYEYAVVDEGWYLVNPQKLKDEPFEYRIDANGRYEPAPNRFTSSARGGGFKLLSDYVHDRGLKFGIHIIRGIPKKAVEANMPIAFSPFRAEQAADTSDTCPWNPDNFGVKNNTAGQAWYDSMMQQYAAWGVDYIKVDCIASHPYKGDEIRMIHRAIVKTGRPIVLSLSPGPAPLDQAAEVAENAQMWRISDDVWDRWERSASEHFPQGVKNQFAVLASWVPYVKPGNWPDADMLPLGTFAPFPGWGDARATRLTHDEQRTLVTLWSIARSPLIVGANLTELDAWTESLLTNGDVIAMDQRGYEQRFAGQDGDLVAWTTKVHGGSEYLALFNTGDAPTAVMTKPWLAYGLKRKKSYKVRDVWAQTNLGYVEDGLHGVMIAPHGVLLLELQ